VNQQKNWMEELVEMGVVAVSEASKMRRYFCREPLRSVVQKLVVAVTHDSSCVALASRLPDLQNTGGEYIQNRMRTQLDLELL